MDENKQTSKKLTDISNATAKFLNIAEMFTFLFFIIDSNPY
jgi:hypothetical protein